MSKNGDDLFKTAPDMLLKSAGPGYHVTPIRRGVFGESSKIREELEELLDAEYQGCKLMVMVEAADLYGALKEFVERRGYTMADIVKFSEITARAFSSGHRTSNDAKPGQSYVTGRNSSSSKDLTRVKVRPRRPVGHNVMTGIIMIMGVGTNVEVMITDNNGSTDFVNGVRYWFDKGEVETLL